MNKFSRTLSPQFRTLVISHHSTVRVYTCKNGRLLLYLKRLLDDEPGLGLMHLPHARRRLAQLRPAAVRQGAAHEIPARGQIQC